MREYTHLGHDANPASADEAGYTTSTGPSEVRNLCSSKTVVPPRKSTSSGIGGVTYSKQQWPLAKRKGQDTLKSLISHLTAAQLVMSKAPYTCRIEMRAAVSKD